MRARGAASRVDSSKTIGALSVWNSTQTNAVVTGRGAENERYNRETALTLAYRLYDGDDPTCTPHHVSAGEIFTEEPDHVHSVRKERMVAYEANAVNI